MKRKTISKKTILIGVIFCIILIVLASNLPSTLYPSTSTTTTTTLVTTTTVPKTGTLLIAVKDVKQKISGLGYATSLMITIDNIQVHKTGDNTTDENVTAKGWITVFNGSKTFDLLEYTDVKAILCEKELDPDKYTQIRLYIENATIKIYNSNTFVYNKTYPMDIAASGNVQVPSKVLKLNHPFTVEEDKAISLTLDFDVPNSVMRATKYILKPVINIIEEKLEKGQKPENSVVL